jgi:pimeloyl-ACP methyl ester carboxylesterase
MPTTKQLIRKWYGSPFRSGGNDMSTATPTSSTITARTQFLHSKNETYAYRRFGHGSGRSLLCLQHFMGTLDNWDPAVADALASGREVILFDNAGVGRSTGNVPDTVQGMATHALAFLDSLGVTNCDVLGFSLGGMIAQQIAQDRPSMFRRMILVGTAPRGGEDIMHLEKPILATPLNDATLRGYAVLQKIFFAPTESSQAAGKAFIERLALRKEDREPASGPDVAKAQIASFREWEQPTGIRYADLNRIRQPVLVVNGVHDEMIPVSNSYALGEHLPNAVLLTYPDSGHGSLFQFHASFTRQAAAFLASDSPFAPY